MPPKSPSSSTSSNTQLPSKEQLAAIQKYLAQKPDFDKLIVEARSNLVAETKRNSTTQGTSSKEALEATAVEEGNLSKTEKSNEINMPVESTIVENKKESEQAEDNLTDKVAQESADSSASLHPIHSPDKATIEHHKANPGPVISQNMPEAESRDDLKKRAEELNKKD